MFEVLSKKDHKKWEQVINEFPNSHDIYSRIHYCELNSKHEKADPRLVIYRDGDVLIAYPFLLRKINSLPFVKSHFTEEIYDITAPYGYGGPLINEANDNAIDAFRKQFNNYCKENNIVSEFIRFHPLLKNHQLFASHVQINHVNDTVSILLNKKEDEILDGFHKNHQRSVRKAIKSNLTFDILQGKKAFPYINIFKKLYDETMRKNNASDYYFFKESYFKQMFAKFGKSFALALVKEKEEVIGAAIFFICGPFMQYHLGASNKEKLNLGTNPFLFYHSALWGKEQGLNYLHLGGGVKKDDPLFTFKKRFNKKGITPFYIGKKIHKPDIYEFLSRLWELYYNKQAEEQFFPKYRQQGEINEKE